MNVFARPIQHMPGSITYRLRIAFIAIFLLGVALRGYASFETLAIIHPDEHQQFLEQANRMVYGYGTIFWEQERNIRHPLYPALLAIPLATLESIGIRDPLLQGALLRWFVSILALLACSMFAWELHRRGDSVAALYLMVLMALTPDIVYWHIHPLSETGATTTLLLALVWLDHRSFLAGWFLGASFAIRFQMGFLIAAIVMFVWVRRRCIIDKPLLLLGSGLTISLACIGLSDRLMFGSWFHSPIGYYRANLIEGVANMWGVEPWYQYVIWLGHGGWPVIAPLFVLAVLGMKNGWPFAILAAGFIFPHMIIGHKEARFMLPVTPFMLALVACGFSTLCRQAPERFQKIILGLGFAAIAMLAIIRMPQIAWYIDPYRTTAYLFRDAGRQPDLIGIAYMGTDRSNCANYFYLRRDVPLLIIHQNSLEALKEAVASQKTQVNYLICATKDRGLYDSLKLSEIRSYNGFTLFQLKYPPDASP